MQLANQTDKTSLIGDDVRLPCDAPPPLLQILFANSWVTQARILPLYRCTGFYLGNLFQVPFIDCAGDDAKAKSFFELYFYWFNIAHEFIPFSMS
jgi:hypothetical protein